MDKKKVILMMVAFCVSFAILPNYASGAYNKMLETDLEFGISVGDELIYNATMSGCMRDINETETYSEQSYLKYKIIKAEKLPSGTESNLTTDLYLWDYTYDFSLDFVSDSAKWIYEDRDVRIINKSLYTMFGGDFTLAVPKDVTIEMLISNDTMDVLAYMFMFGESTNELEDSFMETFGDDFVLTKDVSMTHDIDKPYGRSIYHVIFNGINTTTEEAMQYWIRFETGIKLNQEYGLFEEGKFKMEYGIKVWDTNTKELFVDGGIGFCVDYKLIWASNPAYVTEDFLPYWLKDSWWSQNWGWVVGALVALPVVAFLAWYLTSKSNCANLKDPSQSWACKE